MCVDSLARRLRMAAAGALALLLGACVTVTDDAATQARLADALAVSDTLRTPKAPMPEGWRWMTEGEMVVFVSDRTFQSHYLYAPREVMEYSFAGPVVSRVGVRGGGGTQQGPWSITQGHLCARWNVTLCYRMATNGRAVVARRAHGDRLYAELLNPLQPGYEPPAEAPVRWSPAQSRGRPNDAAAEQVDQADASPTARLRRCIARKPAGYRAVFAAVEARAVALFGPDYMAAPSLPPQWLAEHLEDEAALAAREGRLDETSAMFVRDTFRNCLGAAGAGR